MPCGALRAKETSAQVGVEHAIPVGFLDLKTRSEDLRGGVVDEGVEFAEIRNNIVKQFVNIGALGDVGISGNRAASASPKGLGQGFGGGRVNFVVNGHVV